MTDHLAFLSAIRADPTSDTPRLIYADWLEEQGDGDRAEFVRLQMELAHGQWHSREVEARFGQLRLGWLLEGLPPNYRWFSLSDGCFFISGWEAQGFALEFRRGILHTVALRCADWYHRGPILVREHLLERVRLVDWEPTSEGQDYWNPGPYRWLAKSCPSVELAKELLGQPRSRAPKAGLRQAYPDLTLARAAMSEACLNWARSCEQVRRSQEQESLPPYLAARYDS
jgi:uncharacterized protein (TIGR02996 family)